MFDNELMAGDASLGNPLAAQSGGFDPGDPANNPGNPNQNSPWNDPVDISDVFGTMAPRGTPNLDAVRAINAAYRAGIRGDRQLCNAGGGLVGNGGSVCYFGSEAYIKATEIVNNPDAPEGIKAKAQDWLDANPDVDESTDASSDTSGSADEDNNDGGEDTGAWWENIPDWLITVVDGVRGIFDPSGVFIPIPTGGSGGGTTGTGSGSGSGEDTSGNTGDTSGNTEDTTDGTTGDTTGGTSDTTGNTESGTNDTGSGTNDTGSGTNDTGSGTNDTGSGTNDTGSGTNDTGSDTNDTGAGTNDTGAGTNNAGTGTNDTGTGTNDTGAGTNDTGSGTNDTGSGTNTSGNGSDPGGNGSDTGGLGDVGSACVMPDGGAGVVVMGDGGITFCQGVGSTDTSGGGEPDNSCDCGNGVKGVLNAEGGCDCPTLQIPTPDVDPVGNDGECDCGNGVKGVVNQETGECQCPSIPTTDDGDTPPGGTNTGTTDDGGGFNIPLGFLAGGAGAGASRAPVTNSPLFSVMRGRRYTPEPYKERPIAEWLYQIGEEFKQ